MAFIYYRSRIDILVDCALIGGWSRVLALLKNDLLEVWLAAPPIDEVPLLMDVTLTKRVQSEKCTYEYPPIHSSRLPVPIIRVKLQKCFVLIDPNCWASHIEYLRLNQRCGSRGLLLFFC